MTSSRRSYEESSRDTRIEKMCCTEAEKANQLRMDDLSIQEKESKSTVNQVMVQIQELQHKVNSPNDAREFFDPETASSFGSSHVPSQPMSIPSLRELISRDSCLQDVFEDLLVASEPPAAFFGNSRRTASAPCEPTSLIQGDLQSEQMNWRDTLRILQF